MFTWFFCLQFLTLMFHPRFFCSDVFFRQKKYPKNLFPSFQMDFLQEVFQMTKECGTKEFGRTLEGWSGWWSFLLSFSATLAWESPPRWIVENWNLADGFFLFNIYGLRSKNGRFLRVTYPFVCCLMRIVLGKFMKQLLCLLSPNRWRCHFAKRCRAHLAIKTCPNKKVSFIFTKRLVRVHVFSSLHMSQKNDFSPPFVGLVLQGSPGIPKRFVKFPPSPPLIGSQAWCFKNGGPTWWIFHGPRRRRMIQGFVALFMWFNWWNQFKRKCLVLD